MVRYGNMVTREGSLIGIFEKFLLKEKKKVFNLTDKEMTRFFMTLENQKHVL